MIPPKSIRPAKRAARSRRERLRSEITFSKASHGPLYDYLKALPNRSRGKHLEALVVHGYYSQRATEAANASKNGNVGSSIPPLPQPEPVEGPADEEAILRSLSPPGTDFMFGFT